MSCSLPSWKTIPVVLSASDDSCSEKPSSSPTCALHRRNNQSVIVNDEKDTHKSIAIHCDILPALGVCIIIMKRCEEIKSFDRIALIDNPVILRLKSYKASGRRNNAHRDDNIDSDDGMLYHEAYNDVVGYNHTDIELVPMYIDRFTKSVLTEPS